MENLKVIKNRIKTVSSIAKTTNAMKMVSTIKLSRVNNKNKYAKECASMLYDMFSKAVIESTFDQTISADSWAARTSGKTLIVILSTDQGFCGSFNQSILDMAKSTIKDRKNAYIEIFGTKCSQIKPNRAEITSSRTMHSRHEIAEFASVISNVVFEYITKHGVSEVLVISGEFKNVLSQKARISDVFSSKRQSIFDSEYTLIEGDKKTFIEEIFRVYLDELFTWLVTEHVISELSARVMTMDNSVRNANDMFEKLSVLYNRVRQAKITQELTEIVSSIECVQ